MSEQINQVMKNLQNQTVQFESILKLIFPNINFQSDKSNFKIDQDSQGDLQSFLSDQKLRTSIFNKICKRLSFLNIRQVIINVADKTVGFPLQEEDINELCKNQEVQDFQEYIYNKLKLYVYLKELFEKYNSKDGYLNVMLSKPGQSKEALAIYQGEFIGKLQSIIGLLFEDQLNINNLQDAIKNFEEKNETTISLCKKIVPLCGIENADAKQICENKNMLSVSEDICQKGVKQPEIRKKSNPLQFVTDLISWFKKAKQKPTDLPKEEENGTSINLSSENLSEQSEGNSDDADELDKEIENLNPESEENPDDADELDEESEENDESEFKKLDKKAAKEQKAEEQAAKKLEPDVVIGKASDLQVLLQNKINKPLQTPLQKKINEIKDTINKLEKNIEIINDKDLKNKYEKSLNDIKDFIKNPKIKLPDIKSIPQILTKLNTTVLTQLQVEELTKALKKPKR
jgi:hypothetical protein